MTVGFSCNQRGISIGTRIEIIDRPITDAYLEGAKGYIELMRPDGSTRDLPATQMVPNTVDGVRVVEIVYDDIPDPDAADPVEPEIIFNIPGVWEKGGRIEWPADGRVIAVPRNERVVFPVS